MLATFAGGSPQRLVIVETSRLKLRFLLLHDDKRDQHGGLAMAQLFKKGAIRMPSVTKTASGGAFALRSTQAKKLFLLLMLLPVWKRSIVWQTGPGKFSVQELHAIEDTFKSKSRNSRTTALINGNFHPPAEATDVACICFWKHALEQAS